VGAECPGDRWARKSRVFQLTIIGLSLHHSKVGDAARVLDGLFALVIGDTPGTVVLQTATVEHDDEGAALMAASATTIEVAIQDNEGRIQQAMGLEIVERVLSAWSRS
jgi:hypothetical protein